MFCESPSAKKVEKVLNWFMDRNFEDKRVTVGCKTCNTTHSLMVATALTAWLNNGHHKHEVWIKNPFRK